MTSSTNRAGARPDEEILRERARELARPVIRPPERKESLEVLEFKLARERYAVETRHVCESVALSNLTPLPCVPPFVAGVVNFRGHVLSVIDLKTFFELSGSGLTDLHRVIVISGGDLEFGLLADTVERVCRVELSSLERGLPTLEGIGADYLIGVSAERLIVLDIERMLADSRLIVDDDKPQ